MEKSNTYWGLFAFSTLYLVTDGTGGSGEVKPRPGGRKGTKNASEEGSASIEKQPKKTQPCGCVEEDGKKPDGESRSEEIGKCFFHKQADLLDALQTVRTHAGDHAYILQS